MLWFWCWLFNRSNYLQYLGKEKSQENYKGKQFILTTSRGRFFKYSIFITINSFLKKFNKHTLLSLIELLQKLKPITSS